MNGIITWWARNTVAANLLMVGIFITGIAAFFSLEREVFPSAPRNGATVYVTWLGASPVEVEEQIVLRVEEAIADIDGIKHINSTAREDRAIIVIETEIETDQTLFLSRLKARVDGIATLPREAEPPIVIETAAHEFEGSGIFMALYGDLTEGELNDLALTYRNELAQLPNGSPNVTMWGERQAELSIEVSEETLRQYELTFDDITRAVQQSSLNASAGQVRTDTGNITVATRSLADTPEEFERIIVRQSQDGSILRIGDIATVTDGFEEAKVIRRLNRQNAITIIVNAPEVVNVLEMSKAVNDWVDQKNAELDGKAFLNIWQDSADAYNGRMDLVSSNAVIGLILVLVLLNLFLRPAVALWVTVGIAISFAGAFIFMPATGVSLNMMTLFAFLLVIGIVVDDAIIVGESIHNQTEKGIEGLDAAILGTQLVAKPVIFAVLTTIIAFAPWLFIGGDSSEMTKGLALTISFALIFSLVESFMILPAHLSHLSKSRQTGRFSRIQSFFADGIVDFARNRYQPLIKRALQFRYYTVAFFILAFTFATALLTQGWITFRFMPEVQSDTIRVEIIMPDGTSFSRVQQLYYQLEDKAEQFRLDKQDANGDSSIEGAFVLAEENEIGAFVNVVGSQYRDESTKELSEQFREYIGEIPDAEEISVSYTFGMDFAGITYGVESNDLEALRIATLDLSNILKTLDGVYDVQNNLQSETPELQLSLKPDAQRFGLTLGEVSRQVRQAYYGDEVQRLPRDGQDVRVMVRYPAADRQSLTTIDQMRIRTADGREVPLAAVAQVNFAPTFDKIERRDRKRSAIVSGDVTRSTDLAALQQKFQQEIAPEWRERNPGVDLKKRGDEEQQAEFMSRLIPLYATAFFAIYMLLAIAFSSYWQPLLVMTAIPFGFMGATFGHVVHGIDFAMFSFFGVGAAAGVVVNDNLVLIDRVNRFRAEGVGAFQALVDAGVSRFRPIILTSLTTFIGLLPIMFETSTDGQFLMPTIVSLAWGIFFATFVTLIFVPCMYAVGADIARFYRWAWTGEQQPRVGDGSLGPAE
ncbi:MAG: efflux RND transporter permease subunit [Pseudomonadota bacterium]